MLRGQVVINQKNESLLANDIINDVQFVLYYFSASWCPPCQTFLHQVKQLNEEVIKRKLLMQIFYVSSDHDQDEMFESFSTNHGPWWLQLFARFRIWVKYIFCSLQRYAVPVGPVADKIRTKYHIFSIPSLVVVAKDGRLVSRSGREELEDQGVGVLLSWFPDLEEEFKPDDPLQ